MQTSPLAPLSHVKVNILIPWFSDFAKLFFTDRYFHWFVSRRNELVSLPRIESLIPLKAKIGIIEQLAKFCVMYFQTDDNLKKNFLGTDGFNKFCLENYGIVQQTNDRESKIQKILIIIDITYIAYTLGFDLIKLPEQGLLCEHDIIEVNRLQKSFYEINQPDDLDLEPNPTSLVRVNWTREEEPLISQSDLLMPLVIPIPERGKPSVTETPTKAGTPLTVDVRVKYYKDRNTQVSSLEDIGKIFQDLDQENELVQIRLKVLLQDTLLVWIKDYLEKATTIRAVDRVYKRFSRLNIDDQCRNEIIKLANNRKEEIRKTFSSSQASDPISSEEQQSIADQIVQDRVEEFKTTILANLPPSGGLIGRIRLLATVTTRCHVKESERELLHGVLSNLIASDQIVIEAGDRLRAAESEEIVDSIKDAEELRKMFEEKSDEVAKLKQELAEVSEERDEAKKLLDRVMLANQESGRIVMGQANDLIKQGEKIKELTFQLTRKEAEVAEADRQKLQVLDQLQNTEKENQLLREQLEQVTKARDELAAKWPEIGSTVVSTIFQGANSLKKTGRPIMTIVETSGTGIPSERKIEIDPALLQQIS